jgi:hypothetical protein
MPPANHELTVCSLFDDSACVHDDYEISVFENIETLGQVALSAIHLVHIL